MLADLAVAIGRDGADLRHLVVGGELLRLGLQLGDHGVDGEIDAALDVHGIGAGRDRLGAFLDDRLGEHGGRRGAVARDVGGLGGDLAQHLRAHVLELVLELDLLGDGDAVLGHARRAEGLLEHDVAALGAQGHLDRVGQDVDAVQHLLPGVGVEFHFLGRHVISPMLLRLTVRVLRKRKGRRPARPSASTAAMAPTLRDAVSLTLLDFRGAFDDTHDVVFLHDQQVLAVDLDLGAGPLAEQDLIAGLDIERRPACRSRRACRDRPPAPRPAAVFPWPCRE